MLQSALSSNIFMISQMLYSRFSNNRASTPFLRIHIGRATDQVLLVLVQLIGTWEAKEGSAQLYATSGIVYYMSPPLNFHDALIDPIHTLVYITFVITACAVFSKV
jgi:protein transport protein SEC61 subunit alpha